MWVELGKDDQQIIAEFKWNVVFCVGPKGYQYLSTYDIFDKIKHSLFMCDVPGVISRKESIDYKSFVLHLYYPTLMNIFLW